MLTSVQMAIVDWSQVEKESRNLLVVPACTYLDHRNIDHIRMVNDELTQGEFLITWYQALFLVLSIQMRVLDPLFAYACSSNILLKERNDSSRFNALSITPKNIAGVELPSTYVLT
ncbi:hypothetical protein PM082_014839 [Marasmius tenuissimus]|nr:hypothetical protein PM082_014839 [Marasmius tenuissimus]